uniref:Leucine-rich repeat-containing protein 41 n=1 Tax=Leptobrachium leishanense TaxID=445787 RepID=A0A8C5WEM2_9ANUR
MQRAPVRCWWRRRTQAQRRPAEDGRGAPTLFKLCAGVVSANMDRLEQDVWDLPAVMLQEILPVLNIYYLERIEQTAVKKGLSTQTIWKNYWFELMQGSRTDSRSVKCWRSKFMESLFHSLMRGAFTVSADRLLGSKQCSPLLYSSQYVKEFTITSRHPGGVQLTPGVLERLSKSVETLKLLHLRSTVTVGMDSLKMVLHRLLHHGQVTKIALLSWPAPDCSLLQMILGMSAGFWQDTGNPPCPLCSVNDPYNDSEFAQEPRLGADPPQTPGTRNLSHMQHWENEVGNESALLSLQPLNISPNVAADLPDAKVPGGTTDSAPASPSSSSKNAPTSKDPLRSECQDNGDSKQDDLYDFIFGVSKGDGNTLDINNLYEDGCHGEVSNLDLAPSMTGMITLKDRPIRIPYMEGARYLRSVRTLNMHNITLSQANCLSLCHLLKSWDSLERLTLAYNDLGGNITLILEALSILSNRPGCSLQALALSDFTAYIPTIHLTHTILGTFPCLQTLSLSYDTETSISAEIFLETQTEFTENHLMQLDLRFPQDPLHIERLVPLLQASTSLQELSLDNSSFPDPEIMKDVFRTIAAHNTALKKLSLHDIKLMDAQNELLIFLQNTMIEDVKFSFCRLFERATVDFFTRFAAALRKNPYVKILKLCGNRLGNEGLIVMADIYAPDSVSMIHHLDFSSNCIKPEGLLQFAKKLEKYGNPRLKHLSIAQNLLDREPVASREALRCMEGMFCVVSDRWESTQALVDHLSIMRAFFPHMID